LLTKPELLRWITVALGLIFLLLFKTLAGAEIGFPSALSSVGVQVGETSLGDLVADAVRDAARAQVALVPAGSFKEITLAKGKIKPEDVVRCMECPEERIIIVELSGKQLLTALERSLSIQPQRNMGLLQVSGLAIRFGPAGSNGSRIESVEIGTDKLDETRNYRVAMPDSLADGNYGYFTVWGKEQPRPFTDGTVSKAISGFLATKPALSYAQKTRIVAGELRVVS
jgi:2',3'-cyclic-nucleotide 2'-phosphodiesterase (5'-nucleotidase family)